MENKEKVDWSAAACYLVSITFSAYILVTDGQFCDERFLFGLDNAGPLFPLEMAFLETARAGKGLYRPISQNSIVIAIFTELIQIYDIDQDDDDNHQNVEEEVEK